MEPTALQHWQKLTIIAQDPSIRSAGRIVRTEVSLPAEFLDPGPWGHRLQVVDFDATGNLLYRTLKYEFTADGSVIDPFAASNDNQLLRNPMFHAQNAYAIAMSVIARFEKALGRRIEWSFPVHHLKILPHAFADANAFYSREDQALFFGYFQGPKKQSIFTCLSQDIVAHETTHAILDGVRRRYIEPSSPDQAAFHEAFADIIALLSVFTMREVVSEVLASKGTSGKGISLKRWMKPGSRIPESFLQPESLRRSALLGLAEEVGTELTGIRRQALRSSAQLDPSTKYISSDEYKEPHRRGEILVAATMNAFVDVWSERIKELRRDSRNALDLARVTEEGAETANRILTMAIRSLDYTPPVHLEFGDFLSALLTADHELHPDEYAAAVRQTILNRFASYGIYPASTVRLPERGIWKSLESDKRSAALNYSRIHFESMQRDPEEVFRFVWENRSILGLDKNAYTQVESVRPCIRIGEDGFMLRETVADYVQILELESDELGAYGYRLPKGVKSEDKIRLLGGGALIFDEYGHLKFHIHNHLKNLDRQNKRLEKLGEFGFFDHKEPNLGYFSRLHRLRATNAGPQSQKGVGL
jgi:hypothetical protein